MLTETLELALHSWPEWLRSIELVRQSRGYDPSSPEEARLAWWDTNRPHLSGDCRRALAQLSLPKTFARYWVACFLSDYLRGRKVDFDQIRWPAGCMKDISLPAELVPPGCWRI